MDGKYVGTLKSLGYSKECVLATKRFAVFFVNGPAEQKTNIAKLRISNARKLSSRGKLCQKSTAS